MQSPPGLHRNVVHQAGGTGAVADLGWSDGSFSRPDAFQPVSMLVVALIQVNFVRTNHTFENLRIARHQRLERNRLSSRIAWRNFRIPGDEDLSLGPIEFDPIRKVAADIHGDAIRVNRMGQKLAMDIP